MIKVNGRMKRATTMMIHILAAAAAARIVTLHNTRRGQRRIGRDTNQNGKDIMAGIGKGGDVTTVAILTAVKVLTVKGVTHKFAGGIKATETVDDEHA